MANNLNSSAEITSPSSPTSTCVSSSLSWSATSFDSTTQSEEDEDSFNGSKQGVTCWGISSYDYYHYPYNKHSHHHHIRANTGHHILAASWNYMQERCSKILWWAGNVFASRAQRCAGSLGGRSKHLMQRVRMKFDSTFQREEEMRQIDNVLGSWEHWLEESQ